MIFPKWQTLETSEYRSEDYNHSRILEVSLQELPFIRVLDFQNLFFPVAELEPNAILREIIF